MAGLSGSGGGLGSLYAKGEDKWYDFLEGVSKYVPLIKVTDQIDRVFPSFALFLILIVVILILLALFVSPLGGGITGMNAQILVLDKASGSPLEGVSIVLDTGCADTTIGDAKLTDSTGRTSFRVCTEEAYLQATKAGYSAYNNTVTLTNGETKISLSAAAISQKNFYAKVVDTTNKIINSAILTISCVGDTNSSTYTGQDSNGFHFTTPAGCSSLQLKAKAAGYIEQTKNVDPSDERMIIVLKKEPEINLDSAFGKVYFTCRNANGGVEPNAIISVTNLDTRQATIVNIDNSGSGLADNLAPADYSYTAKSRTGDTNTGSFSISSAEDKDITIVFRTDSSQALDDSSYRYLNLKIVEDINGTQTPMGGVDVSYYMDLNALPPKITTGSDGIAKEQLVLASLPTSTTFYALVKKTGYEIRTLSLPLKRGSDAPTVVTMNQGGATINAKVVDDANAVVRDASVLFYLPPFPAELYRGVTDTNGVVKANYLPQGSYRVVAKNSLAEGETAVSLATHSTQDVNVRLITGTGTIKFKLFDQYGNSVNATLSLYTRTPGDTFAAAESKTSSGYVYTTPTQRVGTEVKLVINDANYFPMETFVYTITRATQEKEVYLRKTGSLPNTNGAQMFLTQVYKSNPIYATGTLQKASEIMPGQTYYLYFDLVLNNTTTANALANIYVSPADVNAITPNNPFKIADVYSTDGASRIMSSALVSGDIDPTSSTNRVDTDAKQANVIFGSQTGPKLFPIIVMIKTDINATGTTKLFWNAKHGTATSLSYFKEFTFGDKFCMTDCPVFLFSNYVDWNGKGIFTPLGSGLYRMLLGDNYTLRTVVKNMSDELIGNSTLTNYVKKSTSTPYYIKFANDTNTVSFPIILNPMSDAASKDSQLVPTAASSSTNLYQKVEKLSGTTNLLDNYTGNDTYIRFEVKTKDQIRLVVNPNVLYAGITPLVLTTYYLNGSKLISAHWKAEQIGADGTVQQLLNYGDTNAVNGLAITTLDLTGLVKGTKIRFTASDDNGAIPAVIDTNISSPIAGVQTPPPECLKVKIGGTDISSIANPTLNVTVGAAANFTVDSNCTVTRHVSLYSDQVLSGTEYDITAGGSQTINVTGTARDGILGAYPLQIMSLSGSAYTQIGAMDIIVSDPSSCFELSNAIFDLRTNTIVSGTIKNKCLAGRKDNFYPKMTISTNNVSLTFNKPGNPTEIDFNATVIGSAIESVDTGGILSNILDISATGQAGQPQVHPVLGNEAKELNFQKDFEGYCAAWHYDGSSVPKPEPDLNITNPRLPMYRLPIPSDWQPSTVQSAQGTVSGPLQDPSQKAAKASFKTVTTKTQVNTDEFDPKNPLKIDDKGYYGDIKTGTATLPSYYPFTAPGGGFVYKIPNTFEGYTDWNKTSGGLQTNLGTNPFDFSHWGNADGSTNPIDPTFAEWGAQSARIQQFQISSAGTKATAAINASYNSLLNDPTCGVKFCAALTNLFNSSTDISGNNPAGFGRPFHSADHTMDFLWSLSVDIFGNKIPTTLTFTPPMDPNVILNKPLSGTSTYGGYDMASPQRWYKDAPLWMGTADGGEFEYAVVDQTGCYSTPDGYDTYGGTESTCNVLQGGHLGQTRMFWQMYIKGEDVMGDNWYCPAFCSVHHETAETKTQFETVRRVEWQAERRGLWEKQIKIAPVEGMVYDLGSYAGASPIPEWTKINTWDDGTKVGDGYQFDGDAKFNYFTVADVTPSGGFINPEKSTVTSLQGCVLGDTACEKSLNWNAIDGDTPLWIIRPASDPLVEYDSQGKVMYYIPQDTIPGYVQGKPLLRMFLKNGHVYAEYIGQPQIASPNIDFNITKGNLLGSEYAILTVSDWIGTGANAQKETKAFQVKLKGNPSSCYALDGTPGYTGASVVPKLKFDWAWDNISSDQCSSDNPNYTYCDATQFTTSLFKRIAEIQTLMNNGRYESIPAKTAFYAYLIKDNYSPNFTTDFGNYYANQAFSPTLFQDPRYPKILTENKLSFTNRAANGTLGGAMPYGGLYRVEINLGLTGASNSLFDASGSLYSPITVTFAPEQKAQNYNPFYETPFDGEVGLLNGAVTRTNYGTSISGGDLALNSAGIKAAGYTGAVTTLGLDTSANLSTLAQRNVLVYDATAKMLRFYPSQPTPVIMNVTGTGAGTTAAYNYKTGNNPEASAPNQEWRMVSSTMGSAKCEDFDGQQKTIFTDSGTSTKSIKWNGNGKGTVGLATMFFTANASDHTLTPTSANPVTLTSFPRLVTGSTNVLLKNYDYPTSPNYNTAYTKLQGVFDMISNETLCMSQSSESTMKVWWNSAYLDNLLAQANGSSSYTCN